MTRRRSSVGQVNQLESSYPGGVAAYIRNARKLLADSKAGVNPLDGWTPSVPTGEKADFGSPAFLEHEALGLQELDGCAFVLVAEGLASASATLGSSWPCRRKSRRASRTSLCTSGRSSRSSVTRQQRLGGPLCCR